MNTQRKRIGSGVYGDVYQSGNQAIKVFKHGLDGSALREIVILRFLQGNSHIVDLEKIILSDRPEIVMPLADSDLRTFLGKDIPYDPIDFSRQIALGLNYCHQHDIIHRDMKPDNILIYGNTLKIADFGWSRQTGCLGSSGMTNPVFTLWYRAPEIFVNENYGMKADVWAFGCIMYEIKNKKPFFPAPDDSSQLSLIYQTLGLPIDIGLPLHLLWPERKSGSKYNPRAENIAVGNVFEPINEFDDVMMKALFYDPKLRISIAQLLQKPLFNVQDEENVECMFKNQNRAHKNPLGNDDNDAFIDYILNQCLKFGVDDVNVIYNAITYFDELCYEDQLLISSSTAYRCLRLSVLMNGSKHHFVLTQNEEILLQRMNFDIIRINPINILRDFDLIETIPELDAEKLVFEMLARSGLRNLRFKYSPYVIANGCLNLVGIDEIKVPPGVDRRSFYRDVEDFVGEYIQMKNYD